MGTKDDSYTSKFEDDRKLWEVFWAEGERAANAVFKPLASRVPFGYILRRLLDAHGVRARGVIHLGGHRGEELLIYNLLGFDKMLFVEAEPSLFEGLEYTTGIVNKVAASLDGMLHLPTGHDRARALNFAVGDRDGTVTVFKNKASMASSIFKPLAPPDGNDAADYYPEVVSSTEVRMRRLDDALAELDPAWQAPNYNVLRLNIQGAELMALQGARETLRHVEFVYSEVNLETRYEGGTIGDAVEEFLCAEGFTTVARHARAAVGDIALVRKR